MQEGHTHVSRQAGPKRLPGQKPDAPWSHARERAAKRMQPAVHGGCVRVVFVHHRRLEEHHPAVVVPETQPASYDHSRTTIGLFCGERSTRTELCVRCSICGTRDRWRRRAGAAAAHLARDTDVHRRLQHFAAALLEFSCRTHTPGVTVAGDDREGHGSHTRTVSGGIDGDSTRVYSEGGGGAFR